MNRPVEKFELTPFEYGKKREKVSIGRGSFVLYGTEALEDERGFTQITVAIVENPDGTVSKMDPEMIKFLDIK